MKITFSLLTFFTICIILPTCQIENFPEPPTSTFGKIEIGTIIIQNITQNEITVSAVYSKINNATSYSFGFCYSRNTAPNLDSEKITLEQLTNDSILTATINLLEPNTPYYVCAFIEIGDQVIYSETIEALTLAPNIIIVLESIIDIGINSAVANGSIENDGGFLIDERGFCYSESPNSTIENTKKKVAGQLGNYGSYISNLKSSTTYYIKAYLVNETGEYYSEEKSFTTKVD